MHSTAYQEFRQYYPQPGWVEHDPHEILNSTLAVISRALSQRRTRPSSIAAIGITNQRETTILWNKNTGKPVTKAIVWQDRRTTDYCQKFKKRGWESFFRRKTGLVLDPYFSGTKILWLLDHIKGLRNQAERGNVLFGTVDSWLLWNLTGKKIHATDATNASRTLLLNIRKKSWDPEILKFLKIPKAILPEVKPSSYQYGNTIKIGSLISGVPICSLVGDQQGALFGQGCYSAGEMKNTYGTGCFILVNQGKRYHPPSKGLLGTLACDVHGKPSYALEGAVFIAGAAIQWIRDGLGLIKKASESEKIARSLKDTGGVFLVPAFTGLGAPYWNPQARGAIFGLTRGTNREHLIKAALESIAYQTADVFEAMFQILRKKPRFLKVDGGASTNNYLMQFQADLLGIPIIRSDRAELTAWGAAKLAGLASGFWKSLKPVDRARPVVEFLPRASNRKRLQKLAEWRQAVRRLLD